MESTTTLQPPRTIREVWDNLPEGTLAQIIENHLIMTPPPTDSHQKTLNEINFSIFSFLKNNPIGEIRIAPYGVYLDDENVFEPDIVFISNENVHKIQENGLHGAPDLVIEILSPSNSKYDKKQKKNVYEQHGVREYWLVDPRTKEVQGFFWEKGEYGTPLEFVGKIVSSVLNYEFEF